MVPLKTEIANISNAKWALSMVGSKLLCIQRKLEDIVGEARKWCLDLKKENGITWRKFEEELSHLQNNISDHASIQEEACTRQALKEKAEQTWWYWKQRAKSKWDAFGDQSTTLFFKSVKTRGRKKKTSKP